MDRQHAGGVFHGSEYMAFRDRTDNPTAVALLPSHPSPVTSGLLGGPGPRLR